MGSVTVQPIALTAGTSGHGFVVGADTALSDGSDSTYIKVDNLDLLGGSLPTAPSITFDAIDVPSGALTDFYVRVRCEQLSGASAGQVVLFDPADATRNASAPKGRLVGLGDGIVEDDGYYSNGILTALLRDNGDLFGPFPFTWRLDFNRSGSGACDFRIYELSLTVVWAGARSSPLRRFPSRHFVARTVNRRAGGTY